MTCSVHLARALVKVGDIVKRGESIAISGYSGFDGFITCPFGIPHIHYNVWLNGVPVDPFAFKDMPSLWRSGNSPIPFEPNSVSESFCPSEYDEEKLNKVISSCKTKKVRDYLNSISELKIRAAETIIEMNYYPTRFPQRMSLYKSEHPRSPTLDLPFSKKLFDGVVFIDEINNPLT